MSLDSSLQASQKTSKSSHSIKSHVESMRSMPPIDPILRKPDVLAVTGIGKSKLYSLIRDGHFPKALVLGPPGSRARGWRTSDIVNWINNRSEANEVA